MAYYFFGMYVLLLPRIYHYQSTGMIPYFKLIGALTNIILNFLLIPIFGIVGSAFATLISFFIMSCYIFYIGNRLEYIQYNLKAWIFPLVIWVIVILFNGNWFITLPLILLYPVIWYKFIINEYEQSKILQILK